MRKPKMLVETKTNRTLNKGYAGVFICEDSKGDRELRLLEGPKFHNDWKAKRNEQDPTKGRAVIQELGVFSYDSLRSLRSEVFKETSFIKGLENYLGYNDNKNQDGESASESLDLDDLVTNWEDLKSKPIKQLKVKVPKRRVKRWN